MEFVHLHLHTDRSLLDGVGRSAEYAELAAKHGQTHLAITDHGNLYGLPEHKRACEKFGIKPIFGCEMYVNDERDKTKEVKLKARQEKIDPRLLDPTMTDNHIVLLAATQEGWKNLLALNHDAVRNGFYYKPRTTHEMILRHAAGLVCTTACIGSQFNRLALRGDEKRMLAMLGKFKDAFGERFFYELHVNELEDQKKVNETLIRVAKRVGVRPLLTSDVHYACAGDCDRQDEMIAVARHTPVNDPKAFKLEARELWFSTPSDLAGLAKKFGYRFDAGVLKNAIANTGVVASMCDGVDIFSGGGLKPPRYTSDAGQVPKDVFRELVSQAWSGLKRLAETLAPGDRQAYEDRAKHELRIIKRTGMADFYLVTADVVRFCTDSGIMVWTRGSGCASLIAMALGITRIDPIRFGLLFERFVDPHRAAAPDFDLDIDATRRDEVVDWLTRKYGGQNGERIARILSLSTFGMRKAIRDISFARGVPLNDAFTMSAASEPIADDWEEKLGQATVADRADVVSGAVEALLKSARPRQRALIEKHKDIIECAMMMVGRVYGKTQHAAGFVLAPGPLREYIPIDRTGSKDGDPLITTAWGEGLAAQDIAPTGIMKLDLLGLETMAVVSECMREVRQIHGDEALGPVDPVTMDFESKLVAAEFTKGGFGLHQFSESSQKLAQLAKRMKPRTVDEIIALVALYRPGSIDHIEEFVARARGRSAIPSVHPVYDEVTAETYGIMVYQEQIMQILHRLGGMPLRDAYGVIKMVSKQQAEKIKAAREQFVSGAVALGSDRALADHIFDMIEKFAGYGFNKAHAASYGVLSWITAYLRAVHPEQFWRAWLNRTENKSPGAKGSERKIESLMRQAASSGITLMPPAIGRSSHEWRVVGERRLVAPLGLVLGVGQLAGKKVRDAWRIHKWADGWEFLEWAEKNKSVLNSKAVKALAQAGAFSTMKWGVERAMDITACMYELKESKTLGSRPSRVRAALKANPKSVLKLRESEEYRLTQEQHALGFTYWRSPWTINDRSVKISALIAADRIAADHERTVRGKRRVFRVVSVRHHTDKKGGRMAFLSLQGFTGDKVEGVVFASVWSGCAKIVRTDGVYLVSGEYTREGSFMVGGKNPFKDLDTVEVA